jgi:Zn-dependent protease with chaperone function/Zn-finger nucleic acid-binding protein
MSTTDILGTPPAGVAGGEAIRRFGRLEVRRERRSRRLLLFALLLGMVIVTAAVVAAVISFVLSFFEPLGLLAGGHYDLFAVGSTLGFALLAAGSYWLLAQMDARKRLLAAMHAQPPDLTDRYHKRLMDIVEELRLASGQRQVECVVVPTTGMNAFAFSDLHGGGVVGVTEGAVSRLSRDQLEAVVAHEFAHIMSGSHKTATVACLLFGIFADDEKVVSRGPAVDRYGAQVAVAGAAGVVAAGAFMALMKLAAAIVSGALSREREYDADQAAAHYTRDPLSMAMALRTIGLNSSGGYIPPGLSALCIRDESAGGGWLARQAASHPPLEKRIDALLALANVRSSDFEAQAAQMDKAAAAKQHLERPPAPVAVPPAFAALTAAGAAPAAMSAGVTAAVARAGIAPAVPSGATSVPTPPASAQVVTPAGGAAPIVASSATAVRPAGAGTPASQSRVASAASHACPSCGAALAPADYEGVRILACGHCGGRWVSTVDVARIVARREVTFTAEQRRLAADVAARGIELRKAAARGALRAPEALRPCPECGATMIRRLYSYDFSVDIDYCARCGSFWFDRDELEVLQVLAENPAS